MTEATADNLYDDAALYERISQALGSDEAEWAFYAERVLPRQGHGLVSKPKVLELGCGSGRLSLPLAAAGCSVTGLDSSAAMLALAQHKAAGLARSAVAWSLQDMRHFKLDRQFDWVLLPQNTLAHLHTLADLQACLKAVLQHLAPQGRFVIDVFNPSLLKLAQGAGHVFPLLDASNNTADPALHVNETSRYDAATQTSALCWHARVGAAEPVQLHFKLRIWFPQELDGVLQLCGLRILHKLGSYQAQPFDSRSQRQLLVCAAADRPHDATRD